ncbi:MAG: dipeptidase [Deferribacteres bacterium]|jgi:dipeptidase D|nr:pepD3 [Deferribacteraceae bacterium]MDK2792692.1 dipeptidase [Deferribacteres bacterium]
MKIFAYLYVGGKMTEQVLKYFKEISEIPRCSKNEKHIIGYLKLWAEKKGFRYKVDRGGNLVVYAGKGLNVIALQSHVDMVCEKLKDSNHDFEKDGIKLVFEGDFVKASGTTLGADNGVGVAIMMALCDDEDILRNLSLELLFTVDEETGLNGANNLEKGLLSSKYMINLDTEDDNEIIIGCAGGRDIYGEKGYDFIENGENRGYLIEIKGLFGGHSGIDIDKNRLNAVKIMAEVLLSIDDVKISSISGGTRHNVIPVSASSSILTAYPFKHLQHICNDICEKYRNAEPGLSINITEDTLSCQYIDELNSREILNLISELPSGVIHKEGEYVVTSANLAKVRTEDKNIKFLLSIRSSVKDFKEKIYHDIMSKFSEYGYNVFGDNDYPAWQPDYNSKLLKIAEEIYRKRYNDLKIKVVHAGLECGIIKEKYPDIDVISIGPDIDFPHSVNERVRISSIGKTYTWVKEILMTLF